MAVSGVLARREFTDVDLGRAVAELAVAVEEGFGVFADVDVAVGEEGLAFAVEEAVPRLSSVDRVVRKFDSAKALVNGIAVISCPISKFS